MIIPRTVTRIVSSSYRSPLTRLSSASSPLLCADGALSPRGTAIPMTLSLRGDACGPAQEPQAARLPADLPSLREWVAAMLLRCRGALASGRLPALCLPRGHDFGRLGHKTVRPFLPPPSDAEKLALAPVRLYGIVTKVVAPGQNSTSAHCLSSKLSGHFISFPQAGPVTLAQEVDVLAQLGSLHEALRAVFVGPQGTRDALLHRLKRCPNMQLRPALMWNYLTVLRLVSESEQRRADDERPASDNEDGAPGEERSKPRRMPNVTGVIPPLAAVRAACDAAWSAIEANSRHTTDMKSDLAARVAANDVAAVRAKGADAGAALGGESPVEGGSTSGAARRATGAGASVPLEGENPLGDLLEPPPTNAGMTVEKVALLERAQPGSAGSNPFSTVNVSPFLWCVPARPRRANPSRAFSPRAPSKSLRFYDTWDRTARDRGGANARAPAPRRRAPRLGIRARVSTRSTAHERFASPRDRRASPAPRPRWGPLRTSAHADAPLPRVAQTRVVCWRKKKFPTRKRKRRRRPSRASPLTSPCCHCFRPT